MARTKGVAGSSATNGLDLPWQAHGGRGRFGSFHDDMPFAAPGGGKTKPSGGGGGKGGDSGGLAPTDIILSRDSIDENSTGGALVGRLSAVDPDSRNGFTFRLVDGAGMFALSGKGGGDLVVADGARLDFETAAFHEIVVEVRDRQGNTYLETMIIRVNDLAEVPNRAPTDILLSDATVSEADANGTEVGRLTAIDPDAGDSFTWRLIDDAGGRFAISGDRLVVKDGALIDYETQDRHSVTIEVADADGLTYTETFEIVVQDAPAGRSDQPYHVQALTLAYGTDDSVRWPDSDPADAPVTITYTVLEDWPSYMGAKWYASTTDVAFDRVNAAEETVFRQMLAEIEELTRIDFVEVARPEDAHVTIGSYMMDGVGAYGWYASNSGATGTQAGDVWLNSRYGRAPSTSEEGGSEFGRQTIAHELGHALGLKHTGDYNAGGGGTPGPYLYGAEDSFEYTTMSYNAAAGHPARPLDYQLYDVAALQYLYGANTTTRSGDDVYAFREGAKTVDTIWDGGGFDRIDVSGFTASVSIDLSEGGFSSIGGPDTVAIAFGAEIEAATGGAGADRISGNGLDNRLAGGGSADVFAFSGAWGVDVIEDFEDGVDLLDFTGAGVGFVDLTLSVGAEGARLSFGGADAVELAGIDASLVDASDFLFAAA